MTNKEVYEQLERVSSLLAAIDAIVPRGSKAFDTTSIMAGIAVEAGEILSDTMNDMDLEEPAQ